MVASDDMGFPEKEGKLSRGGTKEQNGHIAALDPGTQGLQEGKTPPLERLQGEWNGYGRQSSIRARKQKGHFKMRLKTGAS